MKIEGIVTLVFRDIDTGEITKTVKQDNNITTNWIETSMVTNSTSSSVNQGKFGSKIFISGYLIAFTDPDVYKIPLVHGIGFIETGVTSPTIVNSTSTTHGYGQHQQRFAPPANTININIIGLTYQTSISADTTVIAQAYVKLASTCTQTPTETLDIFYRVQFPYDYFKLPAPPDRNTSGISSLQADIMLDRFFITPTNQDYFNNVSSDWNGTMDYTRLAYKSTRNTGHDLGNVFSGTKTISGDSTLHKMKVDTLITIDKSVGNVIGFLSFGQGSTTGINPWSRGVTDLGVDVIQNIFGHSSTATKPFFDSTQQNSGDGTIALNGSSWTNPNFPKQYRLNITGSGALGIGTYQFQVRNHFGFLNNSYEDMIRSMSGMMEQNKHMHDGFLFTIGTNVGTTADVRERPKIIRYDIDTTNTNVLCINKTEVYVFNLLTQTGVLYNVTNNPTFTPTNITQVTYDSAGTIYVACRDTGIYKISTPLGIPTITHIDNTTTGLTGLLVSKCYGIAIGSGGFLWAAFDGGLFSSIDGGVTWTQATFTNATIISDWNRVKFIQVDPSHADQRMALVYESSTPATGTYLQLSILWWNNNTSTDVQGVQFKSFDRNIQSSYIANTRFLAEEPWTYFDSLKPSPTQNKWGGAMGTTPTTQDSDAYPTYFTFNTNTFIQDINSQLRTFQEHIDWELHSSGSQSIISISSVSTSDARISLYKDDNTFTFNKYKNVNSTSIGDVDSIEKGPVCYLGNLVVLGWQPTATLQYYTIMTCGDKTASGGALNYLLYDSYGWNGSNWVLDNPGSKTIHGTAEVLSDGVTIAFDDNLGTQTFVANDYYTFGVLQGIWLDGSTQITHKTGLYFKNILQNQTTLEVGTLSAIPRSPEIFERKPNISATQMTWQDQFGVTTSTIDTVRTNPSTALYDAGARSIEKITGLGLTNKSPSDTIYGTFTFGLYTNMGGTAASEAIACGLSPASVLTTPIDRASVHYGFELVNVGTGVDNGLMADISIIEQGSIVASNIRRIDTTASASFEFEVEILNDGTVNYYLLNSTSTTQSTANYVPLTKDLLYTSAAPAPIVDYYADLAMNGGSVGINTSLTSSPGSTLKPRPDNYPVGGRRLVNRVPDGLYLSIGDFTTSKGRYEPQFLAIDYSQNVDILIDGTLVILILENDIDTLLNAGEISIFAREGFIRYSAADIGKTITATYNVILKQ